METRKEKKQRKFKISRIILIIIVLGIVFIIYKYQNVINTILSPKSFTNTQSKYVTSTSYKINGTLYFLKGGNLWSIHGNSNKKITNINNMSDLAISKNGKNIEYTVVHTNYSNLHQMNINGTGGIKITNWINPHIGNEVWSATPTFSPNGLYIAYLTNLRKIFTGIPRASLGIWMIKTNRVYPSYYGETELTIPTKYTGGDAGVTWPNQNFLLYTEYIYTTNIAQPDSQIMLYDFATNTSYPVTPISSEAIEPRLSPNEKYLAFVGRRHNNDSYLYVMNFNLAQILQNTETSKFLNYKNTLKLVNTGINAQPTWSPNSKSIAFINLVNNSFDIAIKNIKNNKFGKIHYLTQNSNIDSTSKMFWF
ncbi:hypothetical protein M1145_02875 [Patescibacteria group bacterium]|nr:hypothetical protein [Patescibacteria group bacterium]